MTRRRVGVSILAALSLLSSTGVLADQLRQPSKPWVIDYAVTDCTAQRTYGTGSDAVTLALRPSPYGDTYEILLVTKHAGPRYAEELKGSIAFGGAPIKAWLLHYGDEQLSVHKFRIAADAMNQASGASAVTLHINGRPDLSLSLQAMPSLLSGLEQCRVDLQHYWNMTPAEQSRLSAPPVGDVRPAFTADDYPFEAQVRNQEGKATFLLFIDEKGGVAACNVFKPSGAPALDGMGCQVIVKRAKFKPALDTKGQPVRSSIVTPPVAWRLEG
jgi:TonB family protein